MQTPLTCGSYSRRSAIKTLLRNGLTADGSDVNKVTITTAVRALIAQLYDTWVTDDNFLAYQCECDDGTHAYTCCAFDCSFNTMCPCPDGVSTSYACCGCSASSLIPTSMRQQFTKIKGSSTMDGLLTQAGVFMRSKIWTSTDPWLRCVTTPLLLLCIKPHTRHSSKHDNNNTTDNHKVGVHLGWNNNKRDRWLTSTHNPGDNNAARGARDPLTYTGRSNTSHCTANPFQNTTCT